MSTMTKNTVGTALAMTAAGLLGLSMAGVASATDAQVHCYGVTSCSGQNDCKTADNSCKGQASCKGHGFKAMTAEECAAAGGKVGE